ARTSRPATPGCGTGSRSAWRRWSRSWTTTRPPAPSATARSRPWPTSAWCRRSTTPSASRWTWRRIRPSAGSWPNAWPWTPSTGRAPRTSPTRSPARRRHSEGALALAAVHVGVGVVLAAGAFGQADLQRQAVARVGLAQRLLQLDLAFLVEAVQRLVEGLHAFLQRLVHRFLDLVHLAAADQVADHRRVDQDLHRRQALAVLADHQALADHRLEVQRQVHQHVLVGRLREEVQDAVQGLVGVVRVQGGQAEVAGLGEGDRRFHGGGIEDLTDQDDVRRLAHGVLQRVVEGVGVQADLALVDDGLLVPVQELDRILDGEDVAGRVAVAVVDHRRQRGRLAGTGGTDHQHQAALLHHDVLEDLGQLQLVDGGDLALDGADHHADLTALLEHVHAEAAGVLHRDRHVELEVAFELGHLALVHQRIGDLLDHAGRQAGVAQRVKLALDLDVDGCAGGEEHVRRVLLRHQLQEVADVHVRISLGPLPGSMRLMTPTPRKIHLAFAMLLIAAGFSAPAAADPASAIARSEQAVAAAEQAEPRGPAGEALDTARRQLQQAREALEKRRKRDAELYAEAAAANADLARTQARLDAARAEVESRAARNADLRRRLLVNQEGR